MDTKEKEFVLDEAGAKAISEMVIKGVQPTIKENVDAAFATKQAEIEKTEKTIKKNVNGGNIEVLKQGEKSPIEKESKEKRLIKAAIALMSGDRTTLKQYNEAAMEARTKAGYNNTGTSADGGYIVALPEFEAEIDKIVPNYGVAFTDADVRQISSNSIRTNKRGSNVTMYEIGEGVAKPGTKLTISQVELALRKFAAIAIATDELVEDAATDFWAEVTQGFAEERARWADKLVFTDTNATTPGVLRAAGVFVETVGALISSITWDDLMNAESKVPTSTLANAKHYMHPSVWNLVRQSKDAQGRYQAVPYSQRSTPWGTPVVLSDSLPNSATIADSNEPFTVFGDLKRVKLYVKNGLVLTQLKEGTVHDSTNTAINLAEQDMSALRAVMRMRAYVKFPEAFCVIGTGTVS